METKPNATKVNPFKHYTLPVSEGTAEAIRDLCSKAVNGATDKDGKPLPIIEYGSDEWHRLAYRELAAFAGPLRQCRECTHPVAQGYCCGTCGSVNP